MTTRLVDQYLLCNNKLTWFHPKPPLGHHSTLEAKEQLMVNHHYKAHTEYNTTTITTDILLGEGGSLSVTNPQHPVQNQRKANLFAFTLYFTFNPSTAMTDSWQIFAVIQKFALRQVTVINRIYGNGSTKHVQTNVHFL